MHMMFICIVPGCVHHVWQRLELLSPTAQYCMLLRTRGHYTLHAHAQFHPSTTLLPSRDLAYQAPLFLNFTSISFFLPPINTVFCLIEH